MSAFAPAENIRVDFTRGERALLGAFIRNPGQLMTRERLLDAVSGVGSDSSDRSIDFLINRLRRKLRDPARSPALIATRYGEGYVWIAGRDGDAARTAGIFLVVGPVLGLVVHGSAAERGWRFARALAERLGEMAGESRRVVLDADFTAPDNSAPRDPEFSVKLTFFEIGEGRLDAALSISSPRHGAAPKTIRLSVPADAAAEQGQPASSVEGPATAVLDAIWQGLNYAPHGVPAPEDEPLPVRIRRAAEVMSGEYVSWPEAERRLRATLAADPQDHYTRVMLAATVHAKYVMAAANDYSLLNDRPAVERDMAEMRELVTAALPNLADNGAFTLAAAKILHFTTPQNRPLAIDIAETTLRTTTALATAFTVLGDLRASSGRPIEAVELFDRALGLAKTDSQFEYYIQILKVSALKAADDEDGVVKVANRMMRSHTSTPAGLCLFFNGTGDGDVSAVREAVLARLDIATARGIIRYVHFIRAAGFAERVHRQNVLRFTLWHLLARFGVDVIPEEVLPDVPDDLLPLAASSEGAADVDRWPRRVF